MFSLIFGTACLVGLVAVYRGGRRWRYHRRHGGRWLARRLKTNAAQRKVISDAVADVLHAGAKLRNEWRIVPLDLSRALKEGQVDETSMRDAWARQDALVAQLRQVFTTQAARVHQVLDEGQRRELAALLENGPWNCHSQAQGA